MLGLDYLKQHCEKKEIADIISDIERLDALVYWKNWDESKRHLQNIFQKHKCKAIAYNSVNPVPPQTIQQSAANCRRFLPSIGIEKIIEYLN